MDQKKLIKKLNQIKEELDAMGVEYFLVAGYPGTRIGASIYHGRNAKGAAHNAREAHKRWEKEHGIDPNHDTREHSQQ